MKNFVQPGDVIGVTAPYALTSGQGCLVGSLFGIAVKDYDNGAAAEIARTGVYDVTALSTDTASQGAKLYWDNTNKRLTTTASGNTLVGVATAAKTSGQTTARILLGNFA